MAPGFKPIRQGTNVQPKQKRSAFDSPVKTALYDSERINTWFQKLLILYLIIILWFWSRLFIEVNAYCAVENICGGSRVISVC